MGTRGKRARAGKPQPPRAAAAPVEIVVPTPPIPDVTGLDLAFGKIDHLPPYDSLPVEFRKRHDPHVDFVSNWFFRGLKQDDLARLKPKPGVDQNKALAAISVILRSFAPKHEHKEAGCAYLLAQWFELQGATP
jgi:hypothetical protein